MPTDPQNTPNPAPAAAAPAPQAATPAAAPTPAATPPATPAAAPNQNPLAAAPLSLEPAKAAAPAVESPFETTGNPTIDAVVAGLHKAGVDVEKVAGSMLETGAVDAAARAALEKAYGKEVATALAVGLERELASRKEQMTKATETVHGAFGGAEGWAAAQAWAKSNLPEDVQAMLNVGLNKGGAALSASLNLLKGYMEQAGQTVQGAVVQPGAPVQGGVQEITFAAYVKEKQAAMRRGDEGAVKALEARARASMTSYEKKGMLWRSSK